ncbi:MAG: hypothetical protein PHI73_04095 [Patescibacteria group bacterium]|nr:hypothetical protein [Patescibacteria group bacterium]
MKETVLPYAIITGTGATDLGGWVNDYEDIRVETRFGTVWIQRCRINDQVFWHVNRHCATQPLDKGAYRLAHLIEHSTRCAYILALAQQGVNRILAISCVGSAAAGVRIKDVVLPDNYLTPIFCPLSFSDLMPDEAGPEFYREWRHPFDRVQRTVFARECTTLGLSVHDDGLLDIIPGPQFETDADMDDKRSRRIMIVGMATALPESPLAGELGIPYQPACIVTDHPDKRASQPEIVAIAREISPRVFEAAYKTLLRFRQEGDSPVRDAPEPVVGLRQKLGLK